MITIKNRLREVRKAKGLTLQQVADNIGKTKQGIAWLETSEDANPTLRTAFELAEALDTPFQEVWQVERV